MLLKENKTKSVVRLEVICLNFYFLIYFVPAKNNS